MSPEMFARARSRAAPMDFSVRAPARAPRATARGLSLVEVLVVIGVLATLIAVLVPSLAAARAAGRRTAEMSAARQLMYGYEAYSAAHEGALMTGYLIGLSAWDASGEPIGSAVAAARYPWRIAPYLDFAIRGLYSNENADLLERFENDPENYNYLVSVFPSLGLNTTWLGGDQNDNAFSASFLRVFGKYYLTRTGQARRPADLITFASARGDDPSGTLGTGPFDGYFRVRSPWLVTRRWSGDFDPGDPPARWGYLAPRHDGSAVCAFLDAHVDLLPEHRLLDMRHWADRATDPDWHLTPN